MYYDIQQITVGSMGRDQLANEVSLFQRARLEGFTSKHKECMYTSSIIIIIIIMITPK